jgi:hypothetical protein
METTTISVSKETKAGFDEARPENASSADEFLGMLLACWEGENDPEREQTIDVEDARILSQHVEKAIAPYFEEMDTETRHTVQLEATEYSKIADELIQRMR